MSFFAAKAVVETTGVDILRAAAAGRVKKIDYAGLARDIGIPAEHFLEFAAGDRDLAEAPLKALAKHFFDADFDPVANRLKSKNTPAATSIGITPPPFDPKAAHYPPSYDPKAPRSAAINPGAGLTKPWDGTRPGWA